MRTEQPDAATITDAEGAEIARTRLAALDTAPPPHAAEADHLAGPTRRPRRPVSSSGRRRRVQTDADRLTAVITGVP